MQNYCYTIFIIENIADDDAIQFNFKFNNDFANDEFNDFDETFKFSFEKNVKSSIDDFVKFKRFENNRFERVIEENTLFSALILI